MVRRLVILGTGGNCLDILDAVAEINDLGDTPRYECLGFLDDDPKTWEKEIGAGGIAAPCLGPLSAAASLPSDVRFVNGIGSPGNFRRKAEILASTGVPTERFETIVHPTASVSRTARLGRGCVVLQNATIAYNVRVGDHVMILPNSVVSHDDVVGDYTILAGGVCVSGNVTIGSSCYLGTNAAVIGGVAIGDRCMIGMGSVVRKDVAPGTTVVGNPARVLRREGDS